MSKPVSKLACIAKPTLGAVPLLAFAVLMSSHAAKADDGICGSAANTAVISAPSAIDTKRLCETGLASTPALNNGRYYWTCNGTTEGASSLFCYTNSSNGKKNQKSLILKPGNRDVKPGTIIKLSAVGGSGKGKVTFRQFAGDGAKCRLTRMGRMARLKIEESGNCKIMASKAGDENYNGVQAVPISITAGYSATTGTQYKIFLSDTTVKGNLGNPNTGQNVKEWADHVCNVDTARPKTTVVYKAMLSIPGLRYACDSQSEYEGDQYCGPGHDLDWVMQSNTTYYNASGQTIGTTNAFGTFDFPTPGIIENTDLKVWTGVHKNWYDANNCNNWTSGNDNYNGRVGWANKSDNKMIDLEKVACSKIRALYCVEQPQAIISYPQVSAINQYMVTSPTSPINVTFNSVNPINPATVSADSFVVIRKTAEGEPVEAPMPGTITSNGSNVFTFTPNTAYQAGSTYYVNLTKSIQDNQGQPITETTLFFNIPAQKKLIFKTASKYWGDLGSLSGADSKCQTDTACPSGSTCKAIVVVANSRYACTARDACGGTNSRDWVLTPATTYMNVKGQIVSTTNATATFGNGSGKYAFNFPISDGGHAWTGFDQYFMVKYDGGEPVTCSSWSIGDSGINALGGLYGDSKSVYPYAFTQSGGGCSKYTNKVDYGVYVDKQCNAPGGCSERHLYCAQQ